jgi:2,4-dienoyl-CoA reductase-like NADH-dependent reductase (Old Yellow Enzyme family)
MSFTEARLFQPWTHGSLHLRNRVVMAPMTRRMAAEDGMVTEAIVAYYRRRAAGEVGLILSEGTSIDSVHAWDTLTVPRFDTPERLAAWKRVVDAVHAEGGAFAPQLWHTGRLAGDPIGPSAGQAPPRSDGTPRPATAIRRGAPGRSAATRSRSTAPTATSSTPSSAR